MTQIASKKDQFIQPKRRRIPRVGLIILAILLVAAGSIWLGTRGSADGYFGDTVVEARSYVGRRVSMTTIVPGIVGDKVVFPLDEVEKNDIVYFEVANEQDELVSLMAYITPTGRLFVGSSMCEPCRGRRFSLAGETMVCDTCRTTYNIETHEFLSGVPACGSLPPVNMNPLVEDGNVTIDYDEILQWKPRV